MRFRPILLLCLLFALGACRNEASKKEGGAQAPVASLHSEAYNQTTGAVLGSYDSLAEAFVRWDSAAVIVAADRLKKDLAQLNDSSESVLALAKDSRISGPLDAIRSGGNLTDKRHRFHDLTLGLFGFFKDTKYDRSTVYLNECLMPYNATARGVWMSRTPELRNPYLGLHHPGYGGGMIGCGDTIDSVSGTTLK